MVKIFVMVTLILLPTKITELIIVKGKCSFYNDKFEGRKTANGETFRQNKLTAASNYFPLNSTLKVWQDGKDTVTLKVNDRMAKSTGQKRKLDLSKSAMLKIAGKQGIKDGIIDVNIIQVL